VAVGPADEMRTSEQSDVRAFLDGVRDSVEDESGG
jgi:hypothetical protein